MHAHAASIVRTRARRVHTYASLHLPVPLCNHGSQCSTVVTLPDSYVMPPWQPGYCYSRQVLSGCYYRPEVCLQGSGLAWGMMPMRSGMFVMIAGCNNVLAHIIYRKYNHNHYHHQKVFRKESQMCHSPLI